MVADASTPEELPPLEVLVMTSTDFLPGLGSEPPAVLLLTDDLGAAARLMDLPVWGVLPLDASSEELSAALRALGEGLWAGASPATLPRPTPYPSQWAFLIVAMRLSNCR